MRHTLTAMLLIALASMALWQTASSAADADVLTIRISVDGICYFMDTSTPCSKLGQYLTSQHLAQNGSVHIVVDRFSKYELVAATLESLQRSGFKGKIGFVNFEPSQ
jgi:biopolymer transport protein ExbD